MSNYNIQPALLTRTETEWLLEKVKISKSYEYRIKSDIKKKLKRFTKLEIPLLVQKGFIDNNDLSKYSQILMTNPQIINQSDSINTSSNENCAQNMVAGRDESGISDGPELEFLISPNVEPYCKNRIAIEININFGSLE